MRNDKGLKVGDITTAYEKGYHVVISVEPRSHGRDKIASPTIGYKKVLNSRGEPVPSTVVKYCDVHYCTKITNEVIEKIITNEQTIFETKKQNLLKLLETKGKI
jgi:hypothetical protein